MMAELGLPFKFFDSYEVRARLAPAIFLTLPLVLPLWLLKPRFPEGLAGLALVGFASLLALYGLSLLVGTLGQRAELRLWRRWGGGPATQLARWSDDRLDRHCKEALHAAVSQYLRIDLSSPQDEGARPREADLQIEAAFRRVREVLRKRDPNGLWSKHNAEYGFARNSLAATTWGLALTVIVAFACLVIRGVTGDPSALLVAFAEVGIVSPLLILRILVLPAMARAKAERYAESAWEAFLLIAEEAIGLMKTGGRGDGGVTRQDQDMDRGD